MPVTINGNGSIAGLSVGGLGSGVVNTATLANGAASGSKLTMPTGSVIQTVHALKKDVYNSNHYNNYNEIAGLSVTITPTSTSSKLLFTTGITWNTETGQIFEVKLYDGSSEITAANSTTGSSSNAWIASYNKNSSDSVLSDNINLAHGTYLHTISDTNAHTYKIRVRAGSTTLYLNRRENDGGNGGTSYLTVMEIAG